ncbi:hypothetical protein A3F29_00075 [Candidatus Roizmanbacteria bacterium RIFCSPHIGHO2_12_FULL_33_9]|uniref:Uncharacterized protein n=1 Tax=Candidatus Roizmanbacteria bacterium RIFCSPHIGHO2_12_FULL_33_9 TaxID=1802045 RepID=A0A1F7HEY2_9BACT|nr:MAG: hypothetical protein A3F29_00075 [Candidatus Roizmanbacteria bacterium RIFCSPHIGHO2_12_FULL_33_9]
MVERDEALLRMLAQGSIPSDQESPEEDLTNPEEEKLTPKEKAERIRAKRKHEGDNEKVIETVQALRVKPKSSAALEEDAFNGARNLRHELSGIRKKPK